MGLDNVAVQWPRTGRFYEPVAPAEFVDFATLAEKVPATAGPAAALADHVAETGTVRATGYSQLVDLILGLSGVLYATDADSEVEDEDPVIDPDGCAWIAGGLEHFVAGHAELGEEVTIETVAEVLRRVISAGRLAEQQLRWLDGRLAALQDEHGEPPQWSFTLTELSVLASFYRRCADRGFAVYADF
jgi:hypothetical protein